MAAASDCAQPPLLGIVRSLGMLAADLGSLLGLSLLVSSAASLNVYVRGCPGVGTTWFSENLGCLFEGGVERTVPNGIEPGWQVKHGGCSVATVEHPNLKEDMLHKDCSWERDGCVHAVLTRHPSSFKKKLRKGDDPAREARPGTLAVWEKYYGAWVELQAELPAGAVRLFRFEDLVASSCTKELADPEVASFYLKHAKSFDPASISTRNATVWAQWKYEPFLLNDLGEHKIVANSHQEL
jgi:hypothetical protein